MKKFLKEFKEFAVRGNAIDLTVGVIVGGAFGKIISSFVADIIMPPIGFILGGVNFTDLKINLKPETFDAGGAPISPAINVNIGLFLQNVLDFLIIALIIFFLVKLLSNLKQQLKSAVEEKVQVEKLSKEQSLLTEIRDLLKNKK